MAGVVIGDQKAAGAAAGDEKENMQGNKVDVGQAARDLDRALLDALIREKMGAEARHAAGVHDGEQKESVPHLSPPPRPDGAEGLRQITGELRGLSNTHFSPAHLG